MKSFDVLHVHRVGWQAVMQIITQADHILTLPAHLAAILKSRLLHWVESFGVFTPTSEVFQRLEKHFSFLRLPVLSWPFLPGIRVRHHAQAACNSALQIAIKCGVVVWPC